jgi:hypothetical protein
VLKSVQDGNSQLLRKFELLVMRQLSLTQHVMRAMRRLEILRCHGLPLQITELKYKDKVKNLLTKLEGPFQQLQDLSIHIVSLLHCLP